MLTCYRRKEPRGIVGEHRSLWIGSSFGRAYRKFLEKKFVKRVDRNLNGISMFSFRNMMNRKFALEIRSVERTAAYRKCRLLLTEN
jgi:hypothetical protein